MASKSFKGDIIKKYLAKFPTATNHGLARKIYEENDTVFTNKEAVRSLLKAHRGAANGSKKQKDPLQNEFYKKGDTRNFQLPESYADDYSSFDINQSRTLIISDLHIPYHNNQAIEAAIQYGVDRDVNCVLINGDLIDFYPISRFEKDPRQRSVKQEFDAVRQFLDYLQHRLPKARIVYKLGNHCFSHDTEILTDSGFKKGSHISDSDKFATLNTTTNAIEYHYAEKIHQVFYEGDMVSISDDKIDMLVTLDHRLYFKYEGGSFGFDKASNINTNADSVTFKITDGKTVSDYSINDFNKKYSKQHYSGNVFCVTVPNGSVIVRRNDKMHISGNCERWEKWLTVKAPELLDMDEFQLEIILQLSKYKAEIVKNKRPIKIGKLTVLHGHELQGGGGVNPARAVFMKTLESVLVGHSHKTSSHFESRMFGEVINTHSTGALCDLNPQYNPVNKWNLGFAYVELDVKTKEYRLHNLTVIKGKVY